MISRPITQPMIQRDMSVLTSVTTIYTHGGGTPFPNEGLSI